MLPQLPLDGQSISLITVTPPPKGRGELKATLYVTWAGQLVNVAPKFDPSAPVPASGAALKASASATAAQNLQAEFNMLDADSSGFIEFLEFHTALFDNGIACEQTEQWDCMWDKSENGALNYDEYVAWRQSEGFGTTSTTQCLAAWVALGLCNSATSAEAATAEGAEAEADSFSTKLAAMADWGTAECNNFNRLRLTRDAAQAEAGLEGAVLTPDTWHTLCMVVDANAGSRHGHGTLHVYLNGEQALDATVASQDLLLCSKLRLFSGGLAAQNRGGCVRRVAVYNKALSPVEVKIASTQSDMNLLADAAPNYTEPDAKDVAPANYGQVYHSS